jgi:DNA-binding PadR family transcriptional regulator
MSKNELVVLGFLNQKPMHGYQLYREIERTGMEHWAQVNLSSVYNTLNRLEENRMIQAKREKPGKMPERSVYRITKEGKERLSFLLEQTLMDDKMHPSNFMLGVVFIKGLPKDKALGCIRFRVELMQKLLRSLLLVEKDGTEHMAFPWEFMIQRTIDHLRLGIRRLNELEKQIQAMRSWR